jgi:hypothetical protein
VEFPELEFPSHAGADGGFEPFDDPKNFSSTTTITSCSPDANGAAPSTCSNPEFTSTHIVSQIWIDADHWQFTESVIVGYTISRSATDADGGTLTIARNGHANVTFVAAEGMGPGAGGEGTGTTIDIDTSDDLTVTYDLSRDDSAAPCGTATSHVHVFFHEYGGDESHFGSRPTTSGRSVTSGGSITGGNEFDASGGWNVSCGEGDLAGGDGWQLATSGDFTSNSHSTASIDWNVTATATNGQPTNVSGSAGITLGGGGGGSSHDDLSLTAKDKQGDYDAGNGSKSSVDLGWHGGSHGDSGFSMGLGGDFSTNSEGDVDTNLTRDEFDIHANGNGGGNDWFNTNYDAKSKSVSDSTANGWTYHNESDSTGHEDSSVVSDSDSSFTFGLSKATGGDASGSIGLTFNGGSSDGWHVNNESNGKSESRSDGGGSTRVYKSEGKSKYKVDDDYGSSYNGNPGASLNTDGSTTESGSSHAEENYTFDQVSESSAKSSEERTEEYSMSAEIEDPSTRYTMWDKQEYEYREKTTDHYEAALSSDASAGSASSLPTGSDAGYTDAEWFNKSCHSWDDNGTPGGPDCNESTTTDHEDWPSLVDAALAMMQDEAEMAAEGGDSAPEDGGPNAMAMAAYQGNEDTDQTGGGGSETVELLDLAGGDTKLRTALIELIKHANGNPVILLEVRSLVTAWKNTPHNYGWNGGFCGTWLTNFCARLPEKFQGPVGMMDAGDNILKVTPVWFVQGNPSIGSGYGMKLRGIPAGHFAARIRFPDGFIVYFDNGWAGNEAGTEGMFTFSAATGIPIPLRVIYSPIPTSFPEPGWPK